MLRNLTKAEINQKLKDNLKQQIEEKQIIKAQTNPDLLRIELQKKENDLKFKKEEALKKEHKEKLLQSVMDSRRENIIAKNLELKLQKEKMSEIDRLRIELANKELADEKIKLKNKKEEEKNNLMQIIKQKEIKESQKSSVRLKDKEQEKKILIEQDSVLLKQEQDRISHYASIKDRLVLQEERVKNTSEYYKSHNKNYQDTVSVISQLNEINLKRKKNNSNCKDATLKRIPNE